MKLSRRTSVIQAFTDEGKMIGELPVEIFYLTYDDGHQTALIPMPGEVSRRFHEEFDHDEEG